MTVLILTGDDDVTADMVVSELNDKSVSLVRFDPASLSDGSALSVECEEGALRGHLAVGERLLDLDGVRSIWVRRPGRPAARAARGIPWLAEEATQALFGMLDCLDAPWMNHPRAADRARLKLWQLQQARRSGFAVPDSIVTTCPEAARAFVGKYRRVVTKKMSGAALADGRRALPTTLVPADADFREVAVGPTFLQRYIVRRADIRLTVVGHEMFAARKESGPDQVDGRFGDYGHSWKSVEIPPEVRRSVGYYMKRASLIYGAFDLAEDRDGRWWFLECNQGGQFGFIEMETGLPIANSIARWLASPDASDETAIW
jgi:ATP-grasp ribosomal peptide maturase